MTPESRQTSRSTPADAAAPLSGGSDGFHGVESKVDELNRQAARGDHAEQHVEEHDVNVVAGDTVDEEDEETSSTPQAFKPLIDKRKSEAMESKEVQDGYGSRDEEEYESEHDSDEDDNNNSIINDMPTDTDSDDGEDEESDVEVISPEVWKEARRATQQPMGAKSSEPSKKRKVERGNLDPADALYAELFQVVINWLCDHDVEVNDGLQNAIEQIALQCPTTAAGFTSIPGINDEIYDEIGSQLRKITLKYAKRAGKLLASPAFPSKKRHAVTDKPKKPVSRIISVQSVSSGSPSSPTSPDCKKSITAYLRNSLVHRQPIRGSARGGHRLGSVSGGRSGILAMRF